MSYQVTEYFSTRSLVHIMNRVRPGQVLGYGFASWTRAELRTVLDHYGLTYRNQGSKPELWDELKRIAEERGLSKADRISILRTPHHSEGLSSIFPVVARHPRVTSEQGPLKQEPRENEQSIFGVPRERHAGSDVVVIPEACWRRGGSVGLCARTQLVFMRPNGISLLPVSPPK